MTPNSYKGMMSPLGLRLQIVVWSKEFFPAHREKALYGKSVEKQAHAGLEIPRRRKLPILNS
jgi:hypothetical protein